MAQYLLGIDNGGTVAKAALFTVDGRELAVAAVKNEALTPQPGWVEFDMERLWLSAAAAVRQAIAKAGVDPGEIVCVACTGHGNGVYLIDEQGRPVRNGIYSSDTRARPIIERWAADGVDRAIRPKTMQAIWPGQPNALLAWLREHEPAAFRNARWALMCKDYIRFRLTGRVQAELTDMSGTSLMNVGAAEYDPAVLGAFGISEVQAKLPPLCRSADLCGKVAGAAAARTGLVEGTLVAGGLFDIDACGLASALIDESQLSMILGTWGCNTYMSDQPVATDDVFMTSCYSLPGKYLMLEGSATSAGNLEWFLREFFAAEEQAAKAQGGNLYDLVNAQVAAVQPDAAGVLFLPFLYGTNTHADASACLIGMSSHHTRGHVLRAIYEGVAFAHLTHIERLLKVRARPERIRLSGGAARSDVWVQIIADVFQTPVEIPAGSELGAFGAAICAAVAAGCYPSYEAACRAMVRFTRSVAPNRSLDGLYRRKYARYCKLIDTLYPAWPELAWR